MIGSMATQLTNGYEFFPAGGQVPSFSLTAVKSGRQISSDSSKGNVLGLVFHSRETVQAVVEINTTVRPIYPDPQPVILVSVLDLSIVPRLFQGAVKPILEQAYDQAAREIPKGYDPADYVFLLPDWNGAVTKAFKAKNTGKQAAVVVINPQGQVVGSYQGPQPGPATLSLVQRAMER
jgi:hypothetical protein